MLACAVAFFLDTTAALAQRGDKSADDNSSCWQIISAAQGISPGSLVLLNRCEGKSWILVKVGIKSGADHFAWRWAPLFTQDGEAVLQYGK